MNRVSRGRLSSLDLAPPEAQDDIRWALGELNKRQRTQTEILDELNGRLADKGLDLISKSAFNRKAVRTAAAARRIDEARALFTGIAPSFTPESMDETNLVIGEMIKILIMEILDDSDGISPKGAMQLSAAYQGSIRGQMASLDFKQRRLKDFNDRASAAISKVAKARGLGAETVNKLKAEILGVKAPAPESGDGAAP